MSESIHFWRRTDVDGLERLELAIEPEGVRATSTVICLEAGGFRLDHRWQLDADWRAQFVTVERWNSQGHGILRLERAGAGWRVDGGARPDLEGAEEPDLPVTPFCNTFPIRRTPEDAGASLTLDTALIDGSALTVARSTQRYDRQGPGRLRHVDLGLSRGFEADLVVDGSGLVLRYPRIFDYQRHDMANGATVSRGDVRQLPVEGRCRGIGAHCRQHMIDGSSWSRFVGMDHETMPAATGLK